MSITITIDNKPCTCESGEFLIDIAKRNGIFIPTLCSMKPVLLAGDVVTVQPADDYSIGDVLVFRYGETGTLAHRLLLKDGDTYTCKGDNAFHTELITAENIIGKITMVNGNPLPQCSTWLIESSLTVNKHFANLNFSTKQTKQTNIYRFYRKTFIERESNMIYQKNKERQLEYITVTDKTLSVFDPVTGDTHVFNEHCKHILDILDEPCNFETILEQFCKHFEKLPDEIKPMLENFLTKLIGINLITVL